jgi:hypothetical protein
MILAFFFFYLHEKNGTTGLHVITRAATQAEVLRFDQTWQATGVF